MEWDDIITGVSGSLVITAPSSHITASDFPMERLISIAGSVPVFTPPLAPILEQSLETFYYGEVYERIWCVPSYMRIHNPIAGVDIPFILWNAYPTPPTNTLNSITGSGQEDLELDLTVPDSFSAVEERVVNLQITTFIITEISAIFEFNFDQGQGIFTFEALTFDLLPYIPEQPVVETWEWLSDVLIALDSTEQRISVRRQPRRAINYRLLIDQEERPRRELYNTWYGRIGTSVVIPFYQYSTRITQDSLAPALKIYFDPTRTDLRDGESVVIHRSSTGGFFLLVLSEIEPDGATLATPLLQDVYTADILAPATRCRLENLTGPRMTSVSGWINVKASTTEFRSSFNRPGSTAEIEEFDGLRILTPRQLTRNAVPEVFDINPTIVDNQTGLHKQYVSWLHAMVSGVRKFSIPRVLEPVWMDWWRDFLTVTVGIREPFLIASWHRDLSLAVIPEPGASQLEIEQGGYSSQYWPYDTFKRIQLRNSNGEIVYRKVVSVTDKPGGTVLLLLNEGIPSEETWGEDFDISFLNRVRLVSDQVRLHHYALYTIVELSIRTTDL